MVHRRRLMSWRRLLRLRLSMLLRRGNSPAERNVPARGVRLRWRRPTGLIGARVLRVLPGRYVLRHRPLLLLLLLLRQLLLLLRQLLLLLLLLLHSVMQLC